MRHHPTLRPNMLPGFWATLVPALILGVASSGCAAGEGKADSGTSSVAPEVSNPTPTPPAEDNSSTVAPGGATTGNPTATVTPPDVSDGSTPTETVPPPNLTPENTPTPDAANNDPPRLGDDDEDDDGDDDDRDQDDDDGDDDDRGTATPGVPPNPANPDPGTPVQLVTFTSDIRDILLDNCARCHSSGRLPLFAAANAATSYDVAVRERNEIVELIADGEMPADTCRGAPGTNGCVSVADFNLIRQWVAAGAPE